MKKIFVILSCAVLSAGIGYAQTKKAAVTAWPQQTKEMHPWTRWWWMGNAVDDRNTAKLLETYKQAGFGGVEVTPIYGPIGYESRYLQFLSPQWMSALNFTVGKAKTLGMGVDMNTGTGWPFGGPQIKPADAAAKIIVQNYKLAAGQSLTEKIVVSDSRQAGVGAPLQAVTAYSSKGEVVSLLDKVSPDGTLNWKPTDGTWEIYAAFSGKTLQQVKRAAPGGEGYVMDHFSKTAVDTYLKRFDEAFKDKSPGIGSYFNDSYEVYGSTWSPGFFAEFLRLRGYDLKLHLRELMSNDNTDLVARVKSDYRETMSQMLLDNFTLTWTNWAHKYHSLSRNQSHGSPGNILDLYGAVDIPECETFGSTIFPIPGLRRDSMGVRRNGENEPMFLKFASSAAHVTGKPYATSETFTWLAEHFTGSLSQCKPEVEQVFLSGVNHVFFHGTTYSPDDIAFPGWLFYASTNFVPNNSWWDHLPGLNNYITRCQSVLQAGKSDNELIIYWPVYDNWSNPRGQDVTFGVNGVKTWLQQTDFYKTAKDLQKSGYSFDFVSDKMLAGSTVVNGQIMTNINAQSRKVLVIPQCQLMPLATLDKIIALAKAGATVIMQKLPEDVPGLADLDGRRAKLKTTLAALQFTDVYNGIKQCKTGAGQILLAADAQKALEFKNIKGEQIGETGLKFIRRAIAGGKYYYIVNHTAKAVNADLALNIKAASVVIMDPQSGAYGVAKSNVDGSVTSVRVQLQPGEATILKATTAPVLGMPKWTYVDKTGEAETIGGTWALHFTKGGPTLPADQQLSALTSWTNLSDPNAVSFSGSGEYTTTFDVPAKKAADYILNLGKVCESAHVYINGQDAGIFWSIPFTARVGKYLKPGKNTIKVEVDNLMANHIRYMDQNGIQWRKYHEINFVNINYAPFDASKWAPMASGLLGPVTITPMM